MCLVAVARGVDLFLKLNELTDGGAAKMLVYAAGIGAANVALRTLGINTGAAIAAAGGLGKLAIPAAVLASVVIYNDELDEIISNIIGIEPGAIDRALASGIRNGVEAAQELYEWIQRIIDTIPRIPDPAGFFEFPDLVAPGSPVDRILGHLPQSIPAPPRPFDIPQDLGRSQSGAFQRSLTVNIERIVGDPDQIVQTIRDAFRNGDLDDVAR